MTALEMANKRGRDLVGSWVNTMCIGDYPGGVAKVINVWPSEDIDEEVPIIVNLPGYGTMGLIEWENVSVFCGPIM
jgi:hypothetical protein